MSWAVPELLDQFLFLLFRELAGSATSNPHRLVRSVVVGKSFNERRFEAVPKSALPLLFSIFHFFKIKTLKEGIVQMAIVGSTVF